MLPPVSRAVGPNLSGTFIGGVFLVPESGPSSSLEFGSNVEPFGLDAPLRIDSEVLSSLWCPPLRLPADVLEPALLKGDGSKVFLRGLEVKKFVGCRLGVFGDWLMLRSAFPTAFNFFLPIYDTRLSEMPPM